VADRKITDLTALTTPASADVLPIVDVSEAAAADKNKKITVGELLRGAPNGTAAAPSFAFESDGGNGMFLGGTDILAFSTGGSQAVTIDSTGNVGIGNTSPGNTLEVRSATSSDGGIRVNEIADTYHDILSSDGNLYIHADAKGDNGSDNVLRFGVGSAGERARIDSSGRLLVGTSSDFTNGTGTALQSVATGGGQIALGRDASSLSSGNQVGRIRWFSNVGGTAEETARISVEADGTYALGDKPGRLAFFTTSAGASSPTERMRIGNTGNIIFNFNGSGATGVSQFADGTASAPGITFWADGSSDTGIFRPGANILGFTTGGTERARIDSSGRLLVGTSTGRSVAGVQWPHQTEGTGFTGASFVSNSSNPNIGGFLVLGKSAGSSIGSNTVVAANDTLGEILFAGADGSDLDSSAALIRAQVDGTPGSNDMPGRLVFSTTADGASSPTERMRIDASGNITLPSGGNLGINGAAPQSPLDVISNASSYGISLRGRSSDNVSQFRFVSNNHGSGYSLFESGPTYLATHVNGSERVRIDSSGRLLVGTSTARSNFFNSSTYSALLQIEGRTDSTRVISFVHNTSGTAQPLFVLGKSRGTAAGSNTVVQNNDNLGTISFQGADGTELVEAARISCQVEGTPGANDMPGRLTFSTTADGASNATERMRLTADGTLLTFSAANGIVSGHSAAAGTSAQLFMGIHSRTSTTVGGTTSFQVWTNGNVQNTNNSYGAISDIKLKENIVDANSQWDDLKAVQVRKYSFKEETGNPTHTQIGVIAQELELVSPGLVYESPDRDEDGNDLGTVTKSVNYSVLYMKAVKALQEAMERIEQLESKVAALESV
jgi:hypothetical protein